LEKGQSKNKTVTVAEAVVKVAVVENEVASFKPVCK